MNKDARQRTGDRQDNRRVFRWGIGGVDDAVGARLPEPIRVRVKWQMARALVHGRRLLDTYYWRSLYRRLQSQLAE